MDELGVRDFVSNKGLEEWVEQAANASLRPFFSASRGPVDALPFSECLRKGTVPKRS